MERFFGIVAYEYRMSIQRRSFWLAYGLACLPYLLAISVDKVETAAQITSQQLWQQAGEMAFTFNLFLPIVAGILVSDRLVRDRQLGVRELLSSTPLQRGTYIFGKFTGLLLSVLIPPFILVMLTSILMAVTTSRPEILWMGAAAFFTIIFPAHLFVSAFSLALPWVLPLRVYQVLFTGYWFWGNYLNSEVFPTLNGTLLTPNGKFALTGFFGGMPSTFSANSPLEAVLNLVVLFGCSFIILQALYFYLGRPAQQG
jgi:ABC-2 type transport system permease protein